MLGSLWLNKCFFFTVAQQYFLFSMSMQTPPPTVSNKFLLFYKLFNQKTFLRFITDFQNNTVIMPPNMNLMTTKILHIIFNFLIISSSFTFRDKNLMYDVNAAPTSSSPSSSSSSSGIQMKRTPESTVAPLGDEVLFECEPDVAPDQLKWRYHAQNSDDNNKHDYIFITNEMVSLYKKISKYFKCVFINLIIFY